MCWYWTTGWAGGQTDSTATLIMVNTVANSDRVCITTKIDVQILMDHNQNRLQMFAETVGLFLLPGPGSQLYLMIKPGNLLGFLSGLWRDHVLVKCKFYKF